MTKTLVLLIFCTLAGGYLRAELNLLTLREAESLVEKVREVAVSQERGECPQFSATYGDADQLMIQVRRSCGPTGGTLINNYEVNRRTGVVTQWGDNAPPITEPPVKSFAGQLMLRAQRRALSDDEARCVALEAAKALPDWGGGDAVVTVQPFGKAEGAEVSFNANHHSLSQPADSGRLLSVGRDTAWVRDDETGEDLMSASLGSLTSKIFALRAPVWLTDEDAISIARQIPAAAQGIRNGCRFWASGAFRAQEAIVGLSCDGKQAEGATVVAVNLRTGQTTNADTGKVLESLESKRLASQLLAERERKQMDLRKDVDATCHQR
jgi:hypothetical protein